MIKSILLILLVYVVCFVYVVLCNFISMKVLEASLPDYFNFIANILLAGAFVLFYCIREKFKMERISLLSVFKGLLLTFLLYALLIPIWNTFRDWKVLDTGQIMFFSRDKVMEVMDTIIADNGLSYFQLSMVLILPVIEEISFRGIIQKYLYGKCKPIVAILITSIAFAIPHLWPYDITRSLFVGFLLGYLYYRYNSILIPIVCHILWNTLGIFYKTTGNDISIWMILIYCCTWVGFIFLFRTLLKGQYAESIRDNSHSDKSGVR